MSHSAPDKDVDILENVILDFPKRKIPQCLALGDFFCHNVAVWWRIVYFSFLIICFIFVTMLFRNRKWF